MDIVDVRLGWKTDVFNRAGRQLAREVAKDYGQPLELDEKCCFSIVHAHPDTKSLDLVAHDPLTAMTWIRGMKAMLALVKSIQQHKNDHEYDSPTPHKQL